MRSRTELDHNSSKRQLLEFLSKLKQDELVAIAVTPSSKQPGETTRQYLLRMSLKKYIKYQALYLNPKNGLIRRFEDIKHAHAQGFIISLAEGSLTAKQVDQSAVSSGDSKSIVGKIMQEWKKNNH